MEQSKNTAFMQGIREISFFALCETAVFIVFSLIYYHFYGFPGSLSGISFAFLQIPAISFQYSLVLALIAAVCFLAYKKSSFAAWNIFGNNSCWDVCL